MSAALRQFGKIVPLEDVESLMNQLDSDGDGGIDFKEFVDGMGGWFISQKEILSPIKKVGNLTMEEIREIRRVFDLIDLNGDGELEENEILQVS